MKFDISDEWLKRMADLEDNCDITAGTLSICDCPCHDSTFEAYKILKDSIGIDKCSCCIGD